MEESDQTSQQSAKQSDRTWKIGFPVLLGVLCGVAFTDLLLDVAPFNLPRKGARILLVVLGVGLGYCVYWLTKKWRDLFKVPLFIVLLLAGGGLSAWMHFSGNALVGSYLLTLKDWTVTQNGKLSFQYPTALSLQPTNRDEDEMKIRLFSYSADSRVVLNLIVDFTETGDETEKPDWNSTAQEYLKNFINSSLKAVGISNEGVGDHHFDQELREKTYSTKFKYFVGGRKRIGYGILYFDGNHVESVVFLPLEKAVSEAFFTRFIESISIEK